MDQETLYGASAKASLLAATAKKQQASAQPPRAGPKSNNRHTLFWFSALACAALELGLRRSSGDNDEQSATGLAPFGCARDESHHIRRPIREGGQGIIIDKQNWWVLANFREAQIARIQPGTPVDVFLMSDRTTYRVVEVPASASFPIQTS